MSSIGLHSKKGWQKKKKSSLSLFVFSGSKFLFYHRWQFTLLPRGKLSLFIEWFGSQIVFSIRVL